jgi:hypothetical protein
VVFIAKHGEGLYRYGWQLLLIKSSPIGKAMKIKLK